MLYQNQAGTTAKTPREFMGVVENPRWRASCGCFAGPGRGTGLGWRQPFFVPGAIQRELNGPVFYLRANLFIGELLKVVKAREPLFSQASFRDE